MAGGRYSCLVWSVRPSLAFGGLEEAGEHVLQLAGSHDRPAPGTHIGALTHGKVCGLAFDLVADERVNGAGGSGSATYLPCSSLRPGRMGMAAWIFAATRPLAVPVTGFAARYQSSGNFWCRKKEVIVGRVDWLVFPLANALRQYKNRRSIKGDKRTSK